MDRMGKSLEIMREPRQRLGGRDWLLFVTPIGRVVLAAASEAAERDGLLVAHRRLGCGLDGV